MTDMRKFCFTKENIQELVLDEIRRKHNVVLAEEEVSFYHNEDGSVIVVKNEINKTPAPYYDTENRSEIREMLEWSLANEEMIEIVYNKRRGGASVERTARVVRVVEIDPEYVTTVCYVTLRNGRLEYHQQGDTVRKFVIDNIERVRQTAI